LAGLAAEALAARLRGGDTGTDALLDQLTEDVMDTKAQPHTGVIHKLGHELQQYTVISLYLYACFGAILLYKASVLHAEGIDYAPYGLAAIKALILGKFMLVGRAMHIGERYRHKPLIYPVLHKSFAFLAFLIVLSVIEEAVSGAIHGRTAHDSFSEIGGGTWLQIAATAVLLWLILLPYFAFQQIGEVLGHGSLRRMFFAEGGQATRLDYQERLPPKQAHKP
jgi:hypothetical protein